MLVDWLIAYGINVSTAKRFADPLKAAMALNGVHSVEQQAGMMAQGAFESNNFDSMEENLRYTTAAAARRAFGSRVVPHLHRILRNPQAMANFVYANRNGNGDEASGDGWRFRGRGFGLTGRRNYLKASEGCGLGNVFVIRPELVAEPSDACLTFAWYWRSHGCNEMVAAGDFDATTTAINGKARLHADRRITAFKKMLLAHKQVAG
jgi:putative chitinase